MSSIAQATFRALRGLRKPTIAKVEGAAAGAGMFLALGCDIVVAADTARFVASHLNLALPPDWGGIWLLPRLIGLARAKALLLTGRPVGAVQAADWGLIAEAVPAADLDATVAGYGAALAAAPPLPLGLARLGLDRSLDTPLDAFLRWEAVHRRQTDEGAAGRLVKRAAGAASATSPRRRRRRGWRRGRASSC